MSSLKIGLFTIEKRPEGYDVLGPKGEPIRCNRTSLGDAAVEMDKYNLTGGYEKWGNIGALIDSKTFYHGMDIDLEIRQVVKELNKRGYRTLGSCAGHLGEQGYITFEKKVLSSRDRKLLRGILKSIGIEVLRIKNAKANTYYSAVEFRGIGEEVGETPFWLR